MDKKFQSKGHEPNANKNATRLVCPFKFQRDGVAKVKKSSFLIWRKPIYERPNMDEKPKHLTKTSTIC